MVYYLFFEILREYFPPFNIFRYISFRAIYATITALTISLVFGPFVIHKLKQFKIKQFIRDDGPETHQDKAGTPTMGGLLILTSILISVLLWSRLDQPPVLILLLSILWFGLLGFIDDYYKVTRQKSLGLSVKQKILFQLLGALAISIYLYHTDSLSSKGTPNTALVFPFFKNFRPDIGILYIPFASIVIVGASNAVNLTDGLDGLAIGCVIFVAATFGVLGYLTSHQRLADYLDIVHLSINGEASTIFCAALIGSGLGFLWYNCHPAQIFMGDTGSLALGGVIGTIALLVKQEILLVIAGGIFVVEAMSVILQVGSFRIRGKRIFKMAPLHHHFEQVGWKETKVVNRFWIIALILMLVALSTLKIR